MTGQEHSEEYRILRAELNLTALALIERIEMLDRGVEKERFMKEYDPAIHHFVLSAFTGNFFKCNDKMNSELERADIFRRLTLVRGLYSDLHAIWRYGKDGGRK